MKNIEPYPFTIKTRQTKNCFNKTNEEKEVKHPAYQSTIYSANKNPLSHYL